MVKVLPIILTAIMISGCAVNLPFNHRAAYSSVQEAKNMQIIKRSPIAIKWVPSSFPERIDVQGASGFVGGASRTRIPTGVALASRIAEILDASVGVNATSQKVLTIEVISAKTEFEYSSGIFNITPAIDVARCRFEAEFSFQDKRWRQIFTSELTDPTIGGTSQTGLLEKVWDDIAIQVAKNIILNSV